MDPGAVAGAGERNLLPGPLCPAPLGITLYFNKEKLSTRAKLKAKRKRERGTERERVRQTDMFMFKNPVYSMYMFKSL